MISVPARALGLVVAVGALVAIWLALPVDEAALIDRMRAALDALRGSPWAIPVVASSIAAGSLVALPITVMVGAVILALGPVQGFFSAALGTLLGAAATYGVGRFIGRDTVRRLLGSYAERIDTQLERRGVITVALVRKVPIAPFTIVNMLMGASGVAFRDFLIGTALGLLPGIAAFAVVGDRLAEVWREPTPLNVTLVVVAAALWIGVVVGLQFWLNRLGDKRR